MTYMIIIAIICCAVCLAIGYGLGKKKKITAQVKGAVQDTAKKL